MTPQEEKYFEMLVEDREENSKVLEKPSMRGVKRGVVEKYSDQAHFIYELLQNADDVGATRADFILLDDKLLFKHNGIRKFSISDPDNEDADTRLGTLGDINAITSIANSNKTEATIGKFGVGFKAVFQYTNSPAIFEDNVAFRIKNFIVPERLYFDYEERKTGETLFEFPFDKEDCSLEKAFEDISNKLLKLNCPTLFLSNLEEVTFKFGSENGVYKKEQINRRNLEDISAKFLRLIQPNTESQKLWLFSRKSNGRDYCVGFFLDDKGRLKPVDKPAFCFFPTKRVTKLKFIIHAPFLLTDSREGILAGNEHNIKMIRLIAELVADSLLCLRKLRLVDDGILKIIPVRENDFSDSDEISFKPIFNIVKEKMLTAKILPTRDGYTTAENAYWADALHLLDIFSDNRLGELIYNPNAKWIFTTVNRNNADSDVKNYFSDIKSFTEDRILDKIDENFIENQSVEWLHKFYKWLSERRSQKRILDAKSKPFFLDTNHKATAAFDLDGKPQIFLPTVNNLGNYRTICSELLQNPETEAFLRETIGIEEPTLKDMINNKILPLYENHSVTDDTEYFKILFRYYNSECPNKEISTYLLELKKVIYLRNLNRTFSSPSELYMPETNFIKPFVADKPQCLIDMDFYLNLVGDEDELKKFFFKLGVYEELYYVTNEILSYYGTTKADEKHFQIIFYYYKKLTFGERDSYVRRIKGNLLFLRQDGEFASPNDLYLPNAELVEYFSAANCAPFLNVDFYLKIINDEEHLLEFFKELGVSEEVRYLSKEINEWQARNFNLSFPDRYNWEGVKWCEYYIQCSIEIAKSAADNKNADKSFTLWKRLVAINSVAKLQDNIKGNCIYCFRKRRYDPYEPVTLKDLRETAWLVDDNGNFKTPAEITVDTMSEGYDVTSKDALEVIEFFNIAKNNRLTADERHDLTLIKRLKEKYSDEEIEKLIANKNNSSSTLQSIDAPSIDTNSEEKVNPQSEKFDDINTSGNTDLEKENDSCYAQKSDNDNSNEYTEEEKNFPPQKLSAKKIQSNSTSLTSMPILTSSPSSDEIEDNIDYDKMLDKAQKKFEIEKQKIEELEALQQDLQQKVQSGQKYSFGWCKTLLNLEILNSCERKSNNKEISITFGHVEFVEGTERTLLLKYPSRYIPQFIEDLENIPLELKTDKETKNVEIEVAAVRNYTLSVKLKNANMLNDLKKMLPEVKTATISAKNPIFLLEKLQEQFIELGFNDNYNLRDNLCENIEFVFGPPGTGKTYNLAQKIIKLMSEPSKKKILVLTPTNKAADVIVSKIIELDEEKKSYKNWLLRFGTTNDANIEKSGVFHDKTFNIHSQLKNVTVTTIARFPYDFFITSGVGNLRDIDWDYIIIDEASMIMLAQILLPLYKQRPKKFIIAGDPFQIEPVTVIDLWQKENIYTLVALNSFAEPKTIPHNYPVETLTTQYRSVPAIGKIFSELAYKGILNHARKDSDQRSLKIDNWFDVKTLNIIKFPVKKYESIYRPKRLNGTSSYHIYSALFTFEFIKKLNTWIGKNTDEKFSIGIVAPYRAQADLLEKLFASAKQSEQINKRIDIQIGTVHTFQGDECDILFAVFNTPPTISASPKMFLNRLNIINVAISRAKDYLFLIMPDDNTENIENLRLIKEVERLFANNMVNSGEFATQDIEKSIFGNPNYIEENSFATGHQSVNVYARPERKYEIRSEDNAVDVQVHEKQPEN